MKYIILDDSQVVIYITNSVTHEQNGNILVDDDRITICEPFFDEVVELAEIPDYVKPVKYRYINDEFVTNPDWVEPETPETSAQEILDIMKGKVE
jgi:hypothetical protein